MSTKTIEEYEKDAEECRKLPDRGYGRIWLTPKGSDTPIDFGPAAGPFTFTVESESGTKSVTFPNKPKSKRRRG